MFFVDFCVSPSFKMLLFWFCCSCFDLFMVYNIAVVIVIVWPDCILNEFLDILT